MTIGIDLRILQNGHKYRGIGEVGKQITNQLLKIAKADKSISLEFIFFEYDDSGNDPKDLLEIPNGIKYKVVKTGPMPEKESSKLAKLRRAFSELYGNPIKSAQLCDVFLQFDYALGVPTRTSTALISHDFIPLIFKREYFISAWEPFKNKAARSTLRTLFHNYRFNRLQRRAYRRANHIIAISENTKRDAMRLMHVPAKKISVVPHGVMLKPAKTGVQIREQLPTKPYLLFIGAGDMRRRVEDLVDAYNNLKAEGNDIQLALAGENFIAPEMIPNIRVREAVMKSSYKEDILCLGYISDEAKDQLYQRAIAFVYPTLYEGFGIPILEAMLRGCPVITYRNSSTMEVGTDHALYAQGWWGIKEQVEIILGQTSAQKQNLTIRSQAYARQFTWKRSAKTIFEILINITRS